MRPSDITRAVVIAAALTLASSAATAGSFVAQGQCQIASTDPLRYRLRFRFHDERAFGPLCDVRFDPFTVNAIPPAVVLDGEAPAALQFSVDGAGSAHFTSRSPSCIPEEWFFDDSLYMIVDHVPAYFRAHLIVQNGVEAHSEEVDFLCPAPVGVGPETMPDRVTFTAPAPNPARVASRLRFALPRATHVRLAAYEISGRRRRTLVDGDFAAGPHEIAWDFRDDSGREAPSGVYLLRLDAEGKAITRIVVRAR
ncbi:MAG: hypothetical protein HYR74_09910 [Candidatus Eisenbacteria bacterium]|nr:hypothetical protein [Candidatus Eisenbacteria bacterium]